MTGRPCGEYTVFIALEYCVKLLNLYGLLKFIIMFIIIELDIRQFVCKILAFIYALKIVLVFTYTNTNDLPPQRKRCAALQRENRKVKSEYK